MRKKVYIVALVIGVLFLFAGCQQSQDLLIRLERVSVSGGKVDYVLQENYSAGGLLVLAHMDNGSTKTLKTSDYMIDSSAFKSDVCGEYEIVIILISDNSISASYLVRVELPPDVSPEVPPDVSPEVPPDVSPEVPPDVSPEVPPDVSPEVPPDVSPEVPPDSGEETVVITAIDGTYISSDGSIMTFRLDNKCIVMDVECDYVIEMVDEIYIISIKGPYDILLVFESDSSFQSITDDFGVKYSKI